MFWQAAMDLYYDRLKFIPREEAEEFVEQCWNTHLSKLNADIWLSPRNLALGMGDQQLRFSDVVVMSLLHGLDEVRRQSWYREWAIPFNVNFRMPAKVEGLFQKENLILYEPEQRHIQATETANSISNSSAGSEELPRNDNDQRSSANGWQSTPVTQAVTPPPKVTNNIRRQSAVNSEKKTRRMYEVFPAPNEDAPKSPSPRDKSSHLAKKRPHSATTLVRADDKVHPTTARSPLRRRLNMQSSTDTWGAKQSISNDGRSLSPGASLERRTPSTEELLARAEASSPQIYKIVQSEAHKNRQTTPGEQMIDESESEPGVETQNSSATLQSACTNTPVPQSMHVLLPVSSPPQAPVTDTSDDMLKIVKDVLLEKQSLVVRVEALKADMAEKQAKKLQLEQEVKSMNAELESMQSEVTAAYQKLQTGLKLPLR
jgi:hypothetical protein